MQVINLFAGPGCGKSTTAAGLFFEMKKRGMSVELVTEYAKDKTWEEHDSILSDQLYILAKQHRRMDRLRGKVDWVITDGPFLQGLAYTPDTYHASFKPLLIELWNSFENHNVLLQRNENHEYQASGRNQDALQALALDISIEMLLFNNGVPYTRVGVGDTTIRDIMLITKLTA
jgi:hypothetical protein